MIYFLYLYYRFEKKNHTTPGTKSIQSLQRPRTKVQFESMDLKTLMSIKDEAYIDVRL